MDLVDRAYIIWERTNQPRRYRARLTAGLDDIRRRLLKTKDRTFRIEAANDDAQADDARSRR